MNDSYGTTDITRSDIAWSYVAQFMQYGAGLLALPFLLRFLSAEEFGLWAAFLLILGVLQLIDFGLQPSLIRHIAFSVAPGDGSSAESIASKLRSYEVASKKIYQLLLVAVVVFQLTIGTTYILYIGKNLSQVEISAWLVFSIGAAINFYASHLSALIQGIHEVAKVQKLNAAARSINLFATIIGLVSGFGVFSCAIGSTLGAFALFIGCRRALSVSPLYRAAARSSVQTADVERARKALWQTGSQLGSVSVASFLILRSSAVIGSLYLPLTTFASYSLAMQVFQALVSVSRVRFSASISILSTAAHVKNLKLFSKIYKKGTREAWFIYVAFATCICIFGPWIVRTINPNASVLPMISLVCMAFLYSLEIVHGNASMALTCFNRVPFVAAAWSTGFAIVCGSLVVGNVYPNNVLALIFVQICAQLAYNAWKWPLELNILLSEKRGG